MKRVLLVVTLAACGDSKPAIHVTPANICDEIADVACYDMYRCCDDTSIESQVGSSSVPTQDTCVNTLRGRCENDPELAKVGASVATGHMTFDSATLNKCLNAMLQPADACTAAGIPWMQACLTSAWAGTVPINGTCVNSLECADPTTYCAAAPMKECVPKARAGQSCNSAGDCTTGTWCGPSYTCVAITAHGAGCATDEECGPDFACANDGTCEAAGTADSVNYCDAALALDTIGVAP